jgi:hypothetical protein
MKKTVLATAAAAMMLSGIAHANQIDTSFSEVHLRLAFEHGLLNKSELPPLAARLGQLLASDGSIDRTWLKEQDLTQLEADITPYSRLVKLTDGKKVLYVSLD